MAPKPDMLSRIKRIPIPMLILSIALVGLVTGMGAWVLLTGGPMGGGGILHHIGAPTVTTTQTQGQGIGNIPSQRKGTPTVITPTGPVSPLLFGTNMGLFNTNDQVLNSATARTLLQQMHARIIRMPVRSSLPEAVEVQAAQTIKSMGAVPLLVLHGVKDANALADDTLIINDMNRIFGNSIVYYEYGNEDDLAGYSVDQYTASWNAVVPQLKRIALKGQFIGPVNFHYDQNYLVSFLQNAQPRPDEISWHEYTCDDAWTIDLCISHIDHWTTHIQNARAAMVATIGTTLPIMITEWNYAPNAVPNDGKNNNAAFMNTWTTTALQTLAANRIFASMQYSCTNTAIPLVGNDNAITTQGTAFQSIYEQMIVKGQQPAPIAAVATPASAATPTTTQSGGNVVFSFEDGGTDGWSANGQGITNVQNSATVGMNSQHSLQVTLSNASSSNFPYVSADFLNQYPQAGQTITAYVYLPSNSVSLSAKVFLADNTSSWHSGNMVALSPGTWNSLTYTVPAGLNGTPRQVGIQFNSTTSSGISSDVYIDAVGWS